MSSYEEDKEWQQLEDKYPKGTLERQVLDYSRGTHAQQQVPPMLYNAFKLLMGISILMAVVSLVAFLSH